MQAPAIGIRKINIKVNQKKDLTSLDHARFDFKNILMENVECSGTHISMSCQFRHLT